MATRTWTCANVLYEDFNPGHSDNDPMVGKRGTVTEVWEGNELLSANWQVEAPRPTFQSQPRNEISIRREAAQVAQRRMWGEY